MPFASNGNPGERLQRFGSSIVPHPNIALLLQDVVGLICKAHGPAILSRALVL